MLAVTRTLTMTALLAMVAQAGAEVYTWVDETGQVHYSDTWVAGCEEVDTPEFPPAVAPPTPAPSIASPRTVSPEPKVPAESEEPVYKSLNIVSPEQDECLRRLGGIVKVLVDVDPAPQTRKLLQDPGHRLLVSLDGTPLASDFLIGLQDGSLALFLTEVFRGTHQLQVTIEDDEGERLAQSQPVSFHVQEFSIIIRERQIEQRRRALSPPSS